jgi:hypothetical protein
MVNPELKQAKYNKGLKHLVPESKMLQDNGSHLQKGNEGSLTLVHLETI